MEKNAAVSPGAPYLVQQESLSKRLIEKYGTDRKVEFDKLYEPVIKYGGNKTMNKELQELAIKFGNSIGMSIINREGDTPKNNARYGRKYIIHLFKSRNLQQFNDAVIRIQNRFQLQVNKELTPQLNESNFMYVKQFAIIAALNHVNRILRPIIE